MTDNLNNERNPKEEQPWDRQFGEDTQKARQYSRSARNSNGKAVAPLLSVLLFVFIVVVVSPLLFMMWFYWSSSKAEVKPRTADEVMLTKVVETTTAETTTAEAKSTETKANETSVTSTTVAPSDAARQQREQSTSEAQSTQNGAYGTYTVQAGETLYRIAVNHGMDVGTLKSINGLTSNNISPGMQLKVLQPRQ
ncbi:SAG1386/EF1546 family surface-associated protein [Granulicatella elegans]|uniref:SAG1386/EF1546 family surface-associated protein n=1 Tax=Granulicatella elegans TaxID=137732 RepID=UPI0028D556C5|nr:SAG1386/EF1546 family surface-associated protein [Granulicatella elegans]